MLIQSKNIITLIALVFSLLLSMSSAQAAELNKPAPDFTLKSIGGKNLKLSEYVGNVVFLNFWASWCAPCREEMPLLDALHQKYEDLGFVVLGVNVEEQTDLARSYISRRPVKFPILLDPQNQVSKAYNVIAMPTSVVIDRSGNMRYLHQGYKAGDEAQYSKIVKQLIRE